MKKIILALSLLTVKSIFSQNGFTTYSNTIPGSGTVGSENALLIDNAGNKWIGFSNPAAGSAAALAVYSVSTSSWVYYNKINTPTLPSNLVRCLAKDNAGNVWIGTSAGLVKHNAGVFTAYTTTNGLPANNIVSLESINNMLYIGTPSGMSRFDGATFTNYNTGNALLPFNNITAIKAETANDIWLGTSNNLIKFYINSTFTSTSYTVLTPPFGVGNINAIHIDATGNKWLAVTTLSCGFARYDNVNFDMVSTLYPNILSWPSSPVDIGKGPNNGVAFLSVLSTTMGTGATKAIVELFSAGNFSMYVAQHVRCAERII
jgi:ligand-binding sensor domain-containing protein